MSRVLTGPRFVHEAVTAGSIDELWVLAGKHDTLVARARERGIRVHEADRRELDRIAAIRLAAARRID